MSTKREGHARMSDACPHGFMPSAFDGDAAVIVLRCDSGRNMDASVFARLLPFPAPLPPAVVHCLVFASVAACHAHIIPPV